MLPTGVSWVEVAARGDPATGERGLVFCRLCRANHRGNVFSRGYRHVLVTLGGEGEGGGGGGAGGGASSCRTRRNQSLGLHLCYVRVCVCGGWLHSWLCVWRPPSLPLPPPAAAAVAVLLLPSPLPQPPLPSPVPPMCMCRGGKRSALVEHMGTQMHREGTEMLLAGAAAPCFEFNFRASLL